MESHNLQSRGASSSGGPPNSCVSETRKWGEEYNRPILRIHSKTVVIRVILQRLSSALYLKHVNLATLLDRQVNFLSKSAVIPFTRGDDFGIVMWCQMQIVTGHLVLLKELKTTYDQIKASTAVGQAVACAPVTQEARVRSPVGTSFLGEVFSSPVRQMSGGFRPPNIISPSLSSLIIHYGCQ